ncbi:hypothetical protein AHF37_03197 [Paragonimus kellicotti]|nr:hypothetical protein AHF37_03197 [Paragonimus kellicotti]
MAPSSLTSHSANVDRWIMENSGQREAEFMDSDRGKNKFSYKMIDQLRSARPVNPIAAAIDLTTGLVPSLKSSDLLRSQPSEEKNAFDEASDVDARSLINAVEPIRQTSIY